MIKLLSGRISDITIKKLIKFLLFIFVVVSVYNVFNHNFVLTDTLEHIDAAFFITEGLIPYRDFFEHHFPLLWYVLAPIVKLFYRNSVILPVIRILSIILNICAYYVFYKIVAKFLYTKRIALISICVLLAPPYIGQDVINMRPDIFMNLFFLLGLYNFFKFTKKKHTSHLALSYFFMAISFLFLQKIAIILIGFAIINIELIIKKEITSKQLIPALLCGLAPLGALAIYLSINNLWKFFLYYNYTYNYNMRIYYDHFSMAHNLYYISCGCVPLLYLYEKSKTIASKTFLYTGIFAFINVSLFSPYFHYFSTYFLLVTPLIGYILNKSKPLVFYLFNIYIALNILSFLPNREEQRFYRSYITAYEHILDNTTPKDKVAVIDNLPLFPYTPLLNYYWFGFEMGALIDIILNPEIDVQPDRIIKQNKPKYIWYNNLNDLMLFLNSKWLYMRNLLIYKKSEIYPQYKNKIIPVSPFFFDIDHKWITQNYQSTFMQGLIERKDKY